MEETPIELEFEERLHALRWAFALMVWVEVGRIHSRYRWARRWNGSASQWEMIKWSLTKGVNRKIFDLVVALGAVIIRIQVVESEFTRQLRLLESATEVNSAPILEEKEEPTKVHMWWVPRRSVSWRTTLFDLSIGRVDTLPPMSRFLRYSWIRYNSKYKIAQELLPLSDGLVGCWARVEGGWLDNRIRRFAN